MKGITVLTNTTCSKRQSFLTTASKGVISFSNLQKLCVTRKRKANVDAIKLPLSVMVIDPSSVPEQTAKSYLESIKGLPGKKPQIVIIGNDYELEGALNTFNWKKIKELAENN